MSRIPARFVALASENRAAFIPFVMGGDPSFEASLALLRGLPAAGADLIEIGVCFTDPMADGPAIQAAGLRALEAGQTLAKTLELVRAFREGDDATPIVLMGYLNPFESYGLDRFAGDAAAAGVDGVLIVDVPPEEAPALLTALKPAGIDLVRLATPTTDEKRLPAVVQDASGFVYYVSVAGVTGGASGETAAIDEAVARVKAASGLPVAVGFGVKTKARAAEVARLADAVVVGSALVETLAANLDAGAEQAVDQVLVKARALSSAVRAARV